MKKFPALPALLPVLLLTLLLIAAAPACAEDGVPADSRTSELFDLYAAGEGDPLWLASAVPVTESAVITAWSALPEEKENLAVSDGERIWQAKAVLRDGSGLLAAVFFDPEEPPRFAPYSLMMPGRKIPVSAFSVRFGTGPAERDSVGILDAAGRTWRGCSCMLLTLSGDAPQGSVLLDQDGGIAGLLVADYAEGPHRKMALTAGAISDCLTEVWNRLGNMISWGNPPEGYEVTLEGNLMTVDWSGMTLPEKAEGQNLFLVVLDAGNSFLHYYPAETDERSMTMMATPGRVYITGILACRGTPDDLPERYAVTAVTSANDLREHRFRPKLTAVAELAEDAKDGDAPVPVTEVTEDLLRSGRAYFYSSSTYEVDQALPNETLLVTLTDPDGCNYRWESVWLYAPEYMNEDIWYVSLKDAGLTSMLDRKGYPAGRYRLDFYVGGKLADAVTFDLIK